MILAAGRGSRMGAITRYRPKCLLSVGGAPLLEHQISALASVGVAKISIVTGYCSDQIRATVGARANVIHNDDWAETNSLYSFWLCREYASCESLLVLNGDVLAHPNIIQRLLATTGSAFAYDSSSGADEEHMKVELHGDRLHAMCKDLPGDRVDGENVGILRLQGGVPSLLFGEAGPLLLGGGRSCWLASAIERVAQRVPLRGLDVAKLPWCEIDFPADLEAARATTWPALCAAFGPADHGSVAAEAVHPTA